MQSVVAVVLAAAVATLGKATVLWGSGIQTTAGIAFSRLIYNDGVILRSDGRQLVTGRLGHDKTRKLEKLARPARNTRSPDPETFVIDNAIDAPVTVIVVGGPGNAPGLKVFHIVGYNLGQNADSAARSLAQLPTVLKNVIEYADQIEPVSLVPWIPSRVVLSSRATTSDPDPESRCEWQADFPKMVKGSAASFVVSPIIWDRLAKLLDRCVTVVVPKPTGRELLEVEMRPVYPGE